MAITNEVVLSHEHDEYRWVPIDELQKWKELTDFDVSKWPLYINFAKQIRGNDVV